MNGREAKVLEAIRQSKPLPPTIRELCSATGITTTSVVVYYLEGLERKGYIERVPKIARGILLTEKGRNTT
jgi:repressor LexA